MSLPRGTGPARQASIREHNLSVVLDHVLGAGTPMSRARVATTTGLTRATVSALVDDLVRARLLAEIEHPRSGLAGRPAVGLTAHAHGPVAIGLEINVDHLAIAGVDLAGRVTYETRVRSDQRGEPPATTLARIESLAAEAIGVMAAQGRPTIGAALAVPGLVQDHLVRVAPNLRWHDVPVPAELSGLPLHVDNEATLAAQGEMTAAGTASSFLYVSGEIGIGAGIVLDGVVMRGRRGFAGEIGHVAVRPDGPRCTCGAYGCLEQYAGQDAIVAAVGRGGTIADVLERARAGDSGVVACLAEAGRALGIVLAGVVNVLDVTDVLLGGVFAALCEWLGPSAQRELDVRVLAAEWSSPRIRAGALGDRAAVRGAAESVLDTVRRHPARYLAAQ
jgi:predicted NBD/HSP70 family sugar kinase